MSVPDFMEKWLNRSNVSHAAEVAKGEHDGGCEYRDNGHLVCNCKGRKRIASGFTTPPGPLEYQYPMCPKCWTEVGHDGDSFVCETCRVMWSPDSPNDEGEFMDDNQPLDVAKWDAQHAGAAV